VHAGVFFYHIYVSVNDSAYKEIIRSDKDSIRFVVKPAHTYKFYSVAEDYVGNIEDAPGTPDQEINVILPVTWLEFKAYKKNKFSQLEWSTASEYNNRGFEVQRSSDGFNFSRIGWVDGLRNSSSIRSYSFVDSTPSGGKNFYRLKQIDMDSRSRFSEIRKLDFEQPVDFMLYPDPAKDKLTIQFADDKNKEVFIKDIMGRTVWMKKDVNKLSINIPVQQLSKGMYLVLVFDHTGKQNVQKFIKE
jgi:hypothetical protein